MVRKIIRKRLPKKDADLENEDATTLPTPTVDSYRDEICDLLGLRVLHLFKEGWLPIHNFIKSTWKLAEKTPLAYFREGDLPQILKGFEAEGCEPQKHPFGYRSIHYLIETAPTSEKIVAEIQVRTIFEEAWSEIDHNIRYPQGSGELVAQYLFLFNRLAGSADEMGSYVQSLDANLKKIELERQEAVDKARSAIAEASAIAKSHEMTKEELEKLRAKLAEAEKKMGNLQTISSPIYSKVGPGYLEVTGLSEIIKAQEKLTQVYSSIDTGKLIEAAEVARSSVKKMFLVGPT